MAPHSSTIAWKIPWTEEPGRLESMGSQRVGHNWAISLTHSLMAWKVLWLYMFFILPSFHFSDSCKTGSFGKTLLLAYYPSFHLKVDLTNFLNDASIPLSQLYLCNSGRHFLSVFPGLLLYRPLKERKRVDLFTHLSMIWIKPAIRKGRNGESPYEI